MSPSTTKVPAETASPADGCDSAFGRIHTRDLKRRSIRAGTATLVSQAVSYAVTTASVVVLARLLTPEDYGTVAMVTAVTGFVGLFRELGLSSATIQRATITHGQVSALFWINVALGACVMLIIAALAPVLAWFYGKPQLTLITLVVAGTSLVSSLGTQHGALLTREMRFGALAVIQISALVAGFATAVVLALYGAAYWALVSGTVVTSTWNTGGLWVVSPFRPATYRRGSGVRQFLRFGINIAGYDIVNYFNRNMDSVLIGRAWGAQQVGLYSKAHALLMLPIQNLRHPLGRVAFPVLSQLQNDPERFRLYFLKYCGLLAFLSMPLVGLLFVCSKNVIGLLLGSQWTGASELFSILAIAAFIEPIASIRATVMTAGGRADRLFRWGLFNAVATVASFLCGLPWGAKGVAIAYCIMFYLILHPTLVYAFRDSPLRPADFYRAAARPCVASVAMCLAWMASVGRLQEMSDIFILAISLPFCGIVYLGSFFLLPGGRLDLKHYVGYLLSLLHKKEDTGEVKACP